MYFGRIYLLISLFDLNMNTGLKNATYIKRVTGQGDGKLLFCTFENQHIVLMHAASLN